MHCVLPLSVRTIVLFLLTISLSASYLTDVDIELSPNGTNLPDETTQIRVKYADEGKSAQIVCFAKISEGSPNIELQWSKEQSLTACASEKYKDTNKKTGEVVERQRCEISKTELKRIDGHQGVSRTVIFNKISANDFGKYECISRSNFSSNANPVTKSLYLWETITAMRKNEKGKKQRSVMLYEGDDLQIYCNFTGLRNDLFIKWIKDDKDITKELRDGQGNFTCSQNTTEISEGNNLCVRIASMKHRGWYTCQVLKSYPFGDDVAVFPIEHKYYIRVKATPSIIVPGVIIIAEVVVLTIISIITWKNTSEGDKLDGNDWEDDDENDPEENYGTNPGGGGEGEEEDGDLTSKPLTAG